MNRNILNNNKKEKGYTLLFAVLISSLVLAVGVSILNISKKEFRLATSARDSSMAFYAADGGIECAIYGDSKDAFSTDVDNTASLGCGTENTDFYFTKETSPFVFNLRLGKNNKSCAIVTVTKAVDGNGSLITTIDSRGYNTGFEEGRNAIFCDVASAKRVERALVVIY